MGLCIIPARGGSKRLPRKNMLRVNGKSLMSLAIRTAINCKCFDKVIVSSEDEQILKEAGEFGVKRPVELASDTAQIKDVCMHLLKSYDCEWFAVMVPTNPFRQPQDIDDAFKLYNKYNDGVISLVPYAEYPEKALCVGDYVKPYFGYDKMVPAQQLKRLYYHAGYIIFLRTETFLRENELFLSRSVPWFTPMSRVCDIDTPEDLAEARGRYGY